MDPLIYDIYGSYHALQVAEGGIERVVQRLKAALRGDA